MLTAGIICEFDPFHNGHAYLFDQVRNTLGADRIVCVMSGDFTQRGFMAGWDKFDRAKAAVLCGADLVLELPFAYAVSSADHFARGGIRLLSSLGCVTYLAFGSESADLNLLQNAASVSFDEGCKDSVRERLKKGDPYPRSIAEAMGVSAPEGPNDILASCYIREAQAENTGFSFFAVKREGAGHGQSDQNGTFASAGYIRSVCLKSGSLSSCRSLMPDKAYEVLSGSWFAGERSYDRLFSMIRHQILTLPSERIAECPEVSEGLENRIKDAVQYSADTDSLIREIKSKRYTYARISRILIQLICGITKDDAALFEREKTAYAKVLAFSDKGAEMLRESAKNGAEVISNVNKYEAKSSSVRRMLQLDMLSSDIYSIATGRSINKYSDKTIIPKLINMER